MTALILAGAAWSVLAAYSAIVFNVAGWRRPKAVAAWGFSDVWRRRCRWTSQNLGGVPGVYVYSVVGVAWYVGQAVDLGRRIDQHGFDIRFLPCTHVLTIRTSEAELDDTERALIRAHPWVRLTRVNRTRGGS